VLKVQLEGLDDKLISDLCTEAGLLVTPDPIKNRHTLLMSAAEIAKFIESVV